MKLSNCEPVIGENACRSILEYLFTSTRQSLKEFLASIAVGTPNENEGDSYDFDELDSQKLGMHIVNQSDSEKLTKIPSYREYRSEIACVLLERWIPR